MPRGRKRVGRDVICPHCGDPWDALGYAAHVAACARRQAVAEGARRLAETQHNAAETSGQGRAPKRVRKNTLHNMTAGTHNLPHHTIRPPTFSTPVVDPLAGRSDAGPSHPTRDHATKSSTDNDTSLYDIVQDKLNSNMTEPSNDQGPSFVAVDHGASSAPAAASATPRVDDFKTEYHPRAGRETKTQHFEDFRRGRRPVNVDKLHQQPWLPFNSRLDFDFAEFALETSLNRSQITKLLKIVHSVADDRVSGRNEFSFKVYEDVAQSWAAAAHKQAGYEKHEITVTYGDHKRDYVVYCRSLWEWALRLLKDPALAPLFVWHAIKLYKWDGQEWIRFIDEPHTADLWWQIQSLLPAGGVPLCFILYADKTRLSSFGSQKGYPIVARIANLPVDIRNGNGYGGGQVVGLLPVVEDEKEEGKLSFTTFKRVVWHEAFWLVLRSVAEAAKLGERFACGDDIIRLLFPIILILAADYEEHPAAEPRSVAAAKAIITNPNLGKGAMEEILQPLGLRPVPNVFWRVPYCDPYKAVSFDRLHAYHGGLFSDHLFAQFQEIVDGLGRAAVSEADRRFDMIPRWRNLNHFAEVISISFTDGTKYEDISKACARYSMVILRHKSLRGYRLLLCIRRYLILDMYAAREVHTTHTLRHFSMALPYFSEAIQEYAAIHETKNWNFPKMHTHQHAPADILNKGVTRNYNTKPFEKEHGLLKEIYQRRTNFKNIDAQITRADHDFLVAKGIRAHISLLDEHAQAALKEQRSRGVDFVFGHVYLGAMVQPHTTLNSIEQRFSGNLAFTRFRTRLYAYLKSAIPQSEWPSTGRLSRLQPDTQITESKYVKVNYESKVTWRLLTDHLRCNEDFHGVHRLDGIIFQLSAEEPCFGRLHLVFVYTYNKIKYPIALVQVFDDFGLCRLRESKNSPMFIPAEAIIRGALIMEDDYAVTGYLLIDTVDTDMFFRVREYVPFWDT
ncbi:hypothetical protein BC628DRAFT_1536449 [Trametes gibbosa]|nr:hypothetical protein BC628DRAFT_1536449 [Trametes gibbosa]